MGLTIYPPQGGAGTGDVVGPVSSTDNAVVRWNGTTGELVQNSAAFVDDNGNVYAPNLANGYATTATAAGTTTLTVASKGVQTFTGSTTQTVTLPVVSTLPQAGFWYWIINNSSGAVTVNSSGGNAVQVMAASSRMLVVANALSGTGASVWDKMYVLAGSGDVTASGTLTSNAVMLGNGTTVIKAVAGIITDGTSKLTLGEAGTSVGSIDFKNATSGTLNIAPQTGALGTSNLVAPAVSGTLTVNDAAQTLTNKTIDCDSNTVTNVALTKVDADDTLPATCAKGQIITTDNGKFWHGQGTNDWDQILKASDIGGVRAVTGTSDTILSTDFSKMVTYSNASSIAVTLPQAGSGSPASFLSGYYLSVQNLGAGTVTITPTTSTINGAATLVLLSGQFGSIYSDGTNYSAFMPVNKVNGLTVTNSTGTLTVTNAKTASFSNTLTFAGTDGTTMTFPSTTATIARTDAANTFTGTQTFGAVVGTTWNGNTWATGTGTLSIAASKTLTASNSITLAGTDSTTMTFPPASANIGYLESPINSQSDNYTCVLADSGKTILETGASKTVTIPANASVAYAVGTCISGIFTNATGGSVAITSDTMTLANSTSTGTRTVAQNGRWTAQKMTSTTWLISGAGIT
jgi:hypothetical protein